MDADRLTYKITDALIKSKKYIKDYSKESTIDFQELNELINQLNSVLYKFRSLVYDEINNRVNVLTENQIINAFNEGYTIQRCLAGNKHKVKHWGNS